MNIYVYENYQEALNQAPISLTRPTFDLRCGAFTFLERIQKLIPESVISVFVRDELIELTRERFPGKEVNPDSISDGLWLNGTVLWSHDLIQKMQSLINTRFYTEERLIGAYLSEQNGKEWLREGGPVKTILSHSLPKKETSIDMGCYLWDFVNLNHDVIESDCQFFEMGIQRGKVDDGVHLLNSAQITIGERSRIKAGTVLDADEGSIILGENVTVLPGVYLQGPLVIGDNCLIKAGAKIYGGTSLGPGNKVGGEVTNSIFQSWSNKQHGGFIGHAFIGEWINLGAGTNNSDLKNNYSPIKMMVNGKEVNTESLFVGLFAGDHSKTGINTMFNTGTTIGPASNIVCFGFPPKVIPSFSWIVNGEIQTHLFKKFIETARMVKQRRGETFSATEEQLYRCLFDNRSTNTFP